MADAKLSALTTDGAPAAADWLYLVKAAGGDRKATLQNFVNAGLAAPGAIGSGTPAAGTFTTLQANTSLKLPDNVKAVFGTGNDATIYYDGTDMVIDPTEAGSGNLRVLLASRLLILAAPTDVDVIQRFEANSASKFNIGYESADASFDIAGASFATNKLVRINSSGFMALAGAAPVTTTGLLLPATAAGASSLRLPHGTAPSSPVDGDLWTTTSGLFARIDGATVQFATV